MKIQVKKLSSDAVSNICYTPEKIFNVLKLSTDVLYNFHIGQLSQLSLVKPHELEEKYMYFTRPVFNKLLLYSDATLNIWKHDKDIYFGSVVGVLVNTRYLKAIEEGDPPFSAQKHMQSNEAANCLTYYFSVERINWIDKKIKGYTFIPSINKWKYYWFPIPDIIYDRGVGFETENKVLASHIREQFRNDPNIRFINNRDYLGKWQIYKYLSKYHEINKFLPKTVRYTGFYDVLEMLDQYNFIFIKASFGSRGRGVLSIEAVNNRYIIIFYERGLKKIILKDIEEVRKIIENFTKERSFIVQKGINLLKYQDRNMDMRVLIEKNGSGDWEAIYNQSRIANKDLTITNFSAGGDIDNYENIYPYLNSHYNKMIIPDNNEVEKVTIKIATYIEKEFGLFGEIGMDMAIDLHGRIWFIEGNSKPDKDPEPGIEDTEGISPQFLATLEYATFLVKENIMKKYKAFKVTLDIIEKDFPNSYVVTVPISVFERLNNSSQVKLKVGMSEVDVIIYPNPTIDTIELTSSLVDGLGLSKGMITNVIVKEDKLLLGPVVGVFVSNGSVRKANLQTPNFRLQKTIEANKESNTIAYYFSLKDVDFIHNKIMGTCFDYNKNQWEQRTFPMPDILYDRGGGALKKQQIVSKYIRKQLQLNKDLKKVNSQYYFDKYDLYEKLMKHEEMVPYLPLTTLYTKSDDLLKMLKKSSVIYLKKCISSNGRGVIRVIKYLDDSFKLSYFHEEVVEYKIYFFDELVKKIDDIFGNSKIIIQKAIDVIKVNDGNVDMRATVQRNAKGELGVTAYPVRVGIKKSPITSTKSGATVYRLEEFFEKFFSYSKGNIENLKKKIDKLLLTSYSIIEDEYGVFGELGIDFAIDKKGKLWFIECNAKPGKDTVYIAYDENTIKEAFKKPLEYAKYLCDFSN